MPTPKRVQTGGKWAWRVELRPGGRAGKHTSRTGTKPEMLRLCKLVDAMGPAAALAHYDAETAQTTGVTLDEVVEDFLEWKLTGPKKVRSRRTIDDYRRDYRLWIRPSFGSRPAHSVTEGEVQVWVDDMLAGRIEGRDPLDAKTVVDRHALLHQIYAWLVRPAQRERYGVTVNPCTDQDLPSREKKPPKGLRPAEWQALWPKLVDQDRDAAELALGLLSTGWRFSALAALSAHDVEDYGPGRPMYLTQGFVWRDGERVEDTKGSGSRGRRIRVDDVMAAVIRRRLDTVTGDGLVFTTRNGKRWNNNNFRDRYWDPAVKAAGLTRRPTPHWLRHSQAGWMLLTGKASLTEVQRRMGHESPAMTDHYARLVEDVPPAAIDAFVAMRGPVDVTPAIGPGRAPTPDGHGTAPSPEQGRELDLSNEDPR